MYTINKLEELLCLPSNVKKCKINEDELLKYIYRNRNDKSCLFDISILRKIYINHIRKKYFSRKESSEVILTEKIIFQLVNPFLKNK